MIPYKNGKCGEKREGTTGCVVFASPIITSRRVDSVARKRVTGNRIRGPVYGIDDFVPKWGLKPDKSVFLYRLHVDRLHFDGNLRKTSRFDTPR